MKNILINKGLFAFFGSGILLFATIILSVILSEDSFLQDILTGIAALAVGWAVVFIIVGIINTVKSFIK